MQRNVKVKDGRQAASGRDDKVDDLIARINELSRKNKSVGLSEEERVEREKLRKLYLERFRTNFRQQLDAIEWTDEEPGSNIKH